MNKQILAWAAEDKSQRPGPFRNKDLEHLFNECASKFYELSQLTQKKQQLIAKGIISEKPFSLDLNNPRDSKFHSDSLKKKAADNKFKCNVKGCGKIMTSESSHLAHMKKHNDRKNKKIDEIEESQENVSD